MVSFGKVLRKSGQCSDTSPDQWCLFRRGIRWVVSLQRSRQVGWQCSWKLQAGSSVFSGVVRLVGSVQRLRQIGRQCSEMSEGCSAFRLVSSGVVSVYMSRQRGGRCSVW